MNNTMLNKLDRTDEAFGLDNTVLHQLRSVYLMWISEFHEKNNSSSDLTILKITFLR